MYKCPRIDGIRKEVIEVVRKNGGSWPLQDGEVIKSKAIYEAIRKYAKGALSNRLNNVSLMMGG